MAALAAAAAEARDGSPQYVLVSGPAGIGKTRLVAEIAERCAEAGDQVVRGVCVEAGREVALLPLVAPFAALVAARADDARVSPVRDFVEGREPTGAIEGRLARLAEDAYRLLTEGEGTVLIVDDVHWADASTAAVLEYLARRAEPGARLCLIAVARSPHPLPEALADGRVYHRLELEGLADADAVDLAAAAASQAPVGARAGPDPAARGRKPAVPERAGRRRHRRAAATLAAALGARLDVCRRPPARWRTLWRSSAGRSITRSPSRSPTSTTRRASRRCGRLALPASSPQPRSRSPIRCCSRRRWRHCLHRPRTGCTRGPPMRSRRAGGAADAPPRPFGALRRGACRDLEAAADAVGSGAYAEQAAHLLHALDLLDRAPDVGSGVDRYSLTVDAARASWLVGDRERAGELGAAAVELAEGVDRQAIALLWHGMYLEELARGDEAARVWRRGAALVGAGAPAELRHFSEHALGRAALVEGDPEAALAHARTSLEAADSPTDRAHAQTFLGRVLAPLGRVDEGHAALVEACAILRVAVPTTGDPSWAGHAFVFCAASALALDRLDETGSIAAAGSRCCARRAPAAASSPTCGARRQRRWPSSASSPRRRR